WALLGGDRQTRPRSCLVGWSTERSVASVKGLNSATMGASSPAAVSAPARPTGVNAPVMYRWVSVRPINALAFWQLVVTLTATLLPNVGGSGAWGFDVSGGAVAVIDVSRAKSSTIASPVSTDSLEELPMLGTLSE